MLVLTRWLSLPWGDRVFLHCNNGEDVWKVFNDAVHFFGMLFGDIQKWSEADVRYERGAWVLIYGVPVQAWSDIFFQLCVANAGRFLHADECTVHKAHLDFARVLISTPNLEILNLSVEFFIDGRKYVLKMVEEWGCNLGEDVFMTEEDHVDAPEENIPLNGNGLDEVQGEWELDELVNDLHGEWRQHENHKAASPKSPAVSHIKTEVLEGEALQHQQPVGSEQPPQQLDSARDKQDQHASSNINVCQHKLAGTRPWSLAWLSQTPISEGGNAFSSPCLNENVVTSKLNLEACTNVPSRNTLKNKKREPINRSVGFMKRVARMPDMDRRDILKILKNKERKRKVRKLSSSKAVANSTSDSSKNSSSIGNNDWENWVLVHGKPKAVAEDVRVIVKAVGVQYNCDLNNNFNLLTREGRKDWRTTRGVEGERRVVGGSGDGVEDC